MTKKRICGGMVLEFANLSIHVCFNYFRWKKRSEHIWCYVTFLLLGFSMGLQEQGTFSCPECNGSFSSMEALLEHRRTVHKSSYHVMCEECGKVFRSTSGYRNHQKIRHSSDSNVPFCKICGKKFSSSSRLFEHRKKHSDQTYYACQKCGKSFKHARSVKRHDIVCKQ